MISDMTDLGKHSTKSQCYYCGKSFHSKDEVNQHLKNVHSTTRGKNSVIDVVKLNPETPHYVVNFLETSQNYCVCLVDIVGTPFNMCTKINHVAEKNAIVIGSDMYRTVKKIHNYQYQMINSCSVGMKYMYPVYSVSRKN